MTAPRITVRVVAVSAAVIGLVACSSSSGTAGSPHSRSAASGPATETAASLSAAPKKGTIRLSAVGDMIFGITPSLPSDPGGYLDDVDRAIKGPKSNPAQIVFANLEGTLTTQSHSKCPAHDSECFAFRNPPSYGKYFAHDGFTVLNDANNHSHDYGQAGLTETIASIHKYGMKQTGLPGEITLVHANGEAVALVAFAPYSSTADMLKLDDAAALIKKARREAHVVIVYMHAGTEGAGATHVTGHEEHLDGEDRGNAKRFAHLAIRSGASLVIASGPHVLRGMQFYRHHLIAYSLGNFANFHNFGGGGVLSESAILHVSLTPTGGFHAGQLISVVLDGEGHPTLGGSSVSLVRSLSKEDFGSSAPHLSKKGIIKHP
jgi:poly-gamma-glutamate capsule biosynthesis protein CapA/YwtB (metallophosphatase superfamily)